MDELVPARVPRPRGSAGWFCDVQLVQSHLWNAEYSSSLWDTLALLSTTHMGWSQGGAQNRGCECHPFYTGLFLYMPVYQGVRIDKGRKGLHFHKNHEGFGSQNTGLLLKQNLGTI